jgi:hypothetical protein
MESGEGIMVDDALREIAGLLAAAYQRHAKIPLIRPTQESLPSTTGLDNAAEPSLHELTLTRRRKESPSEEA